MPYWYLKVNKTLTDIDRTKQSQQMLQEYEQKNQLFGLSKRPTDKVHTQLKVLFAILNHFQYNYTEY